MNLNGTPNIYVNGTLTTPSLISSTGLVTFSSAPANLATITWTGNFYYRCRFTMDSADFTLFMKDLWALKKLSLIGCPGNKV